MSELEFRLRILYVRIMIAWYELRERIARSVPAWLKSKERLAREAAEKEPWEPMRCYSCMMGHHAHRQEEQPVQPPEE